MKILSSKGAIILGLWAKGVRDKKYINELKWHVLVFSTLCGSLSLKFMLTSDLNILLLNF